VIVLFDDLELDLSRVELRRSGVRVRVERQVFEVLAYLVDHRERVVTKEELMDSVWGGRFVSESAVTSRIKQVRQAVGDDGRTQRLVRTVHGHGYRFVGTVRELARTPAPRPAPVHYAQSDDLQIAYQVTGQASGTSCWWPGSSPIWSWTGVTPDMPLSSTGCPGWAV